MYHNLKARIHSIFSRWKKSYYKLVHASNLHLHHIGLARNKSQKVFLFCCNGAGPGSRQGRIRIVKDEGLRIIFSGSPLISQSLPFFLWFFIAPPPFSLCSYNCQQFYPFILKALFFFTHHWDWGITPFSSLPFTNFMSNFLNAISSKDVPFLFCHFWGSQ